MASVIARAAMFAGRVGVQTSSVASSKAQFLAWRAASTGTVKWFNVSKGYGFLSLDAAVDGGENDDVFVHQTAIQSGGFRFLREGERVEFELTETDRGVQASNVTGVGGVPLDRTRMEYGADSE